MSIKQLKKRSKLKKCKTHFSSNNECGAEKLPASLCQTKINNINININIHQLNQQNQKNKYKDDDDYFKNKSFFDDNLKNKNNIK